MCLHILGIDDDRCCDDRLDQHLVGPRVNHVERNHFDDPPGGNRRAA